MKSSKLGIATASKTVRNNSKKIFYHYSSKSICTRKPLTCDENKNGTRHVFPHHRFTFAESLRNVFIPRYINRYITGKTMTDEYCKSQHALNRLSFSKRMKQRIQSYQNQFQFLVGIKLAALTYHSWGGST